MKPVYFVGCNTTLVAPGCDDLPVMRTDTQMVSTWEMSPEEVAALLKGGKVRISVFSAAHPPVCVWVE